MSAVNNQASFLVSSGEPQEIANTAWAAATLNHPSPTLFKEIDKCSPALVSSGTPQAVANLAWAFAKMATPAPSLFLEIEKQAPRILQQCRMPADISQMAWAAATLGHASPALFREIETRSSFLVAEGKPQEIANTAWAAATLGHASPVLFREIETRADFLVKDGTPQNIANTAWAYGKLRYDAPKLLDAVDEQSEILIKSGTTQNVSNVALAFAEIGHNPASFFNCLEKQENCSEFVRRAKDQDIGNVSWSLVTLGLASENEALLRALWRRAVETDASKFTSEALKQLVQVDVHARASGAELTPAPPGLKKRMIQAAKAQTNTGGRFEDDYSALLAQAGFKHEREVQFLEGDYADFLAIDFACKERKIAVEFDLHIT